MKIYIIICPLLALLVLIVNCSQQPAHSEEGEKQSGVPASTEVISLLGVQLKAPKPGERALQNFQEAKGKFSTDPGEENTIWLGRRMAYLNRYQGAIKIYSEGLKRFPESYRLYRHRGHRYISIRKFDLAIEDLNKSLKLIGRRPKEIEPDGVPNKLKIPLSSTQFNILYHLGLAYYLKGDFAAAAETYKKCLGWCDNDDLTVATVDWLYMTYRRIGRIREAKELLDSISNEMKIIENQAYHKRLLMYKGEISPQSLLKVEGTDEYERNLTLATQGYGVGNWYFYSGQRKKAKEIFQQVLSGKSWSAFGFIAAEAEMHREFNLQKKSFEENLR